MLICHAHERTWCIVSHSVITMVLMAESYSRRQGESEDVRTFAQGHTTKWKLGPQISFARLTLLLVLSSI